MATPQNVPTFELELDKPRRLTAVTLAALRRIKEIIGDAEEDQDTIAAKVWCMLSDEDRAEVSIADLEGMIWLGNMAAVKEALDRALVAGMPEGKVESVTLEPISPQA